MGGPSYTPTATGGGSGNPVTFTVDSSSSSGASISGGAVELHRRGTCTSIQPRLGQRRRYAAAPQVQQSFPVGKGLQAISFTSSAPTGATVGGPSYTPTATGGARGTRRHLHGRLLQLSVCSISGGAVSFTAVGTCTVDANQAGNANYAAAPRVQQSFPVLPGSQTSTPTTPTTTAPPSTSGGGGAAPTANRNNDKLDHHDVTAAGDYDDGGH